MPATVIQAPEHFEHVGQLPGGLVGHDPRQGMLADAAVIDLRYCDFCRPPAALWCLIYPLLVVGSGQSCDVIVPENIGVARYLKTIGLFDLLKNAGVTVDDRGVVPTQREQIAVPLQRFDDEYSVDRMANEALENLSQHDLGAANMRPIVIETFAELAANAVEHSESPIGSFGMIQYYETERGNSFICVVADGGIGIRSSLEKNPDLRARIFYDWTAIELALQERTSGTGLPTRGIGLYGIAEDMRKPGRQLLIHSGQGIVRQTEELETDARRGTLFPGTLAFASITG
jgi:anti-sigma regulatory factor (Ser/Thr protein kinase)